MSRNKIFILLTIVLLILVIIIAIVGNHRKSVIKKPNATEVEKIIQDKSIKIIDARTKEEYEEGHIPNAINIPYNEIENKVGYKKDQPIAVYCCTGVRSNQAALSLEKMGYTKIYDLGGIENLNIELTTN